MKDLPINDTSVNKLNVRPNLFNHNFALLDWVVHPKFKFKFIYSHLFKFVQYNNNKKQKEVKTELAIYWIKHNKRKKCVAAKGAKLSSWLLPDKAVTSGWRSYRLQMFKHGTTKKKQNKNIYAHVNEHHWRKANHVWTKSHNGSWFELRLTNSELLGFSSSKHVFGHK